MVCSSLTSITLGNNVKTIKQWAFNQCTKLKTIIIPDSVTAIEEGAFANCTNLISVYIGSGLQSFEMIFLLCIKLTTIEISEKNQNLKTMNEVI